MEFAGDRKPAEQQAKELNQASVNVFQSKLHISLKLKAQTLLLITQPLFSLIFEVGSLYQNCDEFLFVSPSVSAGRANCLTLTSH